MKLNIILGGGGILIHCAAITGCFIPGGKILPKVWGPGHTPTNVFIKSKRPCPGRFCFLWRGKRRPPLYRHPQEVFCRLANNK